MHRFADYARLSHIMRMTGGLSMSRGELPTGAAQLQLADGVAVLRSVEAVFEAMVTGWTRQQLARNLSPGAIASRNSVPRRCRAEATRTCFGSGPPLRQTTGRPNSAESTVPRTGSPGLSWRDPTVHGLSDRPSPMGGFPSAKTDSAHIRCKSSSSRTPLATFFEATRDPRKRAYTVDELQDPVRHRGRTTSLRALVT